jgi:hypothetical protein
MVVTYSFSIASAQQSYTKFLKENSPSLKHLAEFINSASWNQHQTPHHKLVRRQSTDESTFTPEDEAFCTAQLIDIQCSTGITQGFIDAELSCNRATSGGIEQAQLDANACARNEHGQYCVLALSMFEDAVRRDHVVGNCSGVVTSNSCPIACRTQLEDFRSKLGCCINAHVNSSVYYGYQRTILDYRLWNLCNVSLPPEGCDNGPTINTLLLMYESVQKKSILIGNILNIFVYHSMFNPTSMP